MFTNLVTDKRTDMLITLCLAEK